MALLKQTRVIYLSLMLMLTPLLPAWVCADSSNKTVYQVGVEDIDYRPLYSFGYAPSAAQEILNAFARSQNIVFVYHPLRMSLLYSQFLKTQELDFKFPDDPTWQTELRGNKSIYYSKGFLAYIDGLMVNPKHKTANLADIRSIGTLDYFTVVAYQNVTDANKIHILRTNNVELLVKSAAEGRINGVYANLDIVRQLSRRLFNDPNRLSFNVHLPYQADSYKLSTRKHPHIITAFNQFVDENQVFIEEVRQRFELIPKPEPKPEIKAQ
jgi:hypothetical protein